MSKKGDSPDYEWDCDYESAQHGVIGFYSKIMSAAATVRACLHGQDCGHRIGFYSKIMSAAAPVGHVYMAKTGAIGVKGDK